MSQKRKSKEEIVAEYLTGNYTYCELGLKYGIPFRSICGRVLEYQGRKPTHREKIVGLDILFLDINMPVLDQACNNDQRS